MSDNEIAKQSQSLPSINIHAEHEGVAIGYTDSVNTTLMWFWSMEKRAHSVKTTMLY